jgi:crossover junction endodeoxyribonuclease RuvC
VSRPIAWLGADPGLSGAIALLTGDCLAVLDVKDMPAMTTPAGKRVLDHWALASILGGWTSVFDIKGATVELVHSMPKQGVTSSFSFGSSFGALCQGIASAGLDFALIPPATWKAIYGLRGGRENKELSRAKASELFPGHANLWKLKKHDGRAEAVLLAHYGSKLRTT